MQTEISQTEARLSARYRTMLILWGAITLSVFLYFGFAFLSPGPQSETNQSQVITFALTAVGVSLAIFSFAIKQKFFAQAELKQAPALVQTGLIIALALCEASALFGLVDHFVTGNRYYYVLFIVALIGMALHFPRREQLASAGYRLTDQN
jgi:hypothetical protein